MVYYIDTTGFIGQIVSGMSDFTGSLFLSLLIIFILLIIVCLAFRVPILFTGLLLMPLLITLTSFTNDFMSLAGVFLLYLGMSLGELFYFR